MTRPDLDALEALLAKATPGPWRVDRTGNDEDVMRTVHGKQSAGGCEVCIVTTGSYDDATEAKNAALIVAAVNALPELIARVRELERERDQTILNRACADALVSAAQDMTQAAALAMRERCAQACEIDVTGGTRAEHEAIVRTLRQCAAAIRALEELP